MAKLRRVVRKPRNENHGDVFDDQLWPTYIALIVLGAFSMGVSMAYKSFSAREWYNNATTYLILIPVLVAGFMLAIWMLDNRAWRRSMQFSAIVCVIVHLAFVVQMMENYLEGPAPPSIAEAKPVERRPPKPIPLYRPQQLMSAEDRPQQDHEKPVETETPEVTRQPEEVVRPEVTQDTPAPPKQQPIPVPEIQKTTEPNIIKKPQPNEAAPKVEETQSKLSRQVKPAEVKVSSLIQQPQTKPEPSKPAAEVKPAAAPTERSTAAANVTPREVKEPTTQTESPTASVAKRTEQTSPTTETTAQPTLQRQVAKATETPKSQVAAADTPTVSKATATPELKPANTTTTKTTTASPEVARNTKEPLPEVSTQPTPQPQRRQQDSPTQPTIAQTATPVPNRQPRTTERPDVKTQAAVVTPSTTAGQPSATEAALTPQTSSPQRATATVTAPKPTLLPSTEPNTPDAAQAASRITRMTGQTSPTATANPTQTPTLTRNTNNAPSVPAATKVETTAAAPSQVASSNELSPTSTATQRSTTPAEQQSPTTGQPRPTAVATNTTTHSANNSPKRTTAATNSNDAPATTPGTNAVASRSTQAVQSNAVTTVSDVPANAGPQTSASATLGPSSASTSRQTANNSPGATRTQPTAAVNVASPTAQVSHGGAARAQNSTTPTIDPSGTPGKTPQRAVATAAQATSPTAVDSPAQSVAAQGAGDPSAQPARMALNRSLGGVAGVGKSPNMDRSLPGGSGPALVASSAARRAEATQASPMGEALAPSETAQIARARAGAQAPTASLKAQPIDYGTAPGANEVAQVTASSSAALTRADSDAKPGEVTGAKGSGEVDVGPTQIVAEAGTGRAAGGGQAELNFETNAPQIARKTDTGGSPTMSLASAKVDDTVAAPMGTSGGQTAASDPGPAATSAARTLAGGAAPASGGPSRAEENGPTAEVNTAAMLAESPVSRRDNVEGATGGAAAAGQPDLEDEEEKARRLARQKAGGGPQLALAGPVVADVPQSPMGTSGDGGAPNAAPQFSAAAVSSGRENQNGGAPQGGAMIAAGDPGTVGKGGADQVGSITVTRAEAAAGSAGAPALGGGTGTPNRAATGITVAANTQAETVELAGAPQSGGAANGQPIEAQGTEPQRLAGGAAGPAAEGPTGAFAGPQVVDAATAGGPGEAAGRRNASAATADGPQVGGTQNTGAPGARAATTQIAGAAATFAEVPETGPTSAVAQAELDHNMGNMGNGPMTRNSGESVAVNIEAPDGAGGIGAEHTPKVGLNTRQAREESVQIQVQTARFLRQKAGGLPSVSTSVVVAADSFANRKSRDKGNTTGGGKGSPPPQTEAAVEMGLQFLARYQQPDGRWSLQGFGEETQLSSDTAATALSLLAFQGAGYNHREHQYKDVVRSGLDHLLANQKENGDLFVALGDDSNQSVWLYSHAIATIALCEAYGMTQDPELRIPAQKALDFIVEAQHKERGGWRYAPGVGSDTSVSGWMMMALKSGELSNLTVPKETYAKIDKWLDASQKSAAEPHEFRYNPYAADTPEQRHGMAVSKTMTSVGLLMRLYSGSKRDSVVMREGAEYLKKHLPAIGTPRDPQRDTYYWYYGTQVMYHMGGDHWKAWNSKLHPLLVDSQIKQGPLAGSWQPRGPVPDRWSAHGGRVYVTTMNLLSLEVYYRHLPLYEDTAK